MKNIRKSVFVCGGHVSPAIALIEDLALDPRISFYYLGRKSSLEGDSAPSLEYKAVRKSGLPFLEMTSGRFSRFISRSSVSSLMKIPAGFIMAARYLKKYRPSLVVSFGGYISLPVCLTAVLFGIPVVVHEQTTVLGLASRLVSLFPVELCLSFPGTSKVPFFRKAKITGLPVRNSIINPRGSGITRFGNTRLPLIYVTGGSQGSASLNAVIYKSAPALLRNYRLFHVCGLSEKGYDYHRLSQLRGSLDSKSKTNYYLTPFLDMELVGEVLSLSSLVIGRSGANTVAEIAIHRKKAVLVPLPWAADSEQQSNAEILQKAGLAQVINQDRLTDKLFLTVIDELMSSPKEADSRLIGQLFPLDGAERLSGIIKNKLFPAS